MDDQGSIYNSRSNIDIAYLHAITCPNSEANTFDAVWSASALSYKVNTTFFVKSIKGSKKALYDYYYLNDSPLKIRSMNTQRIPEYFLKKYKNYFGWLISAFLKFGYVWKSARSKKTIITRDPKLLRYFGLLRGHKKWLKDCCLIYEAHDPFGYDPNVFQDRNPFEQDQQIVKAASNFDIILCNTQTLAEDLEAWSGGLVKPIVTRLASKLPRLENPPVIKFKDEILVGCIGTIDRLRGVDILIQSIPYLPKNYKVRIIGRFRHDKGMSPNWLAELTDDPQIRDRLDLQIVDHILDVAAEIDQCDILVQPASSNLFYFRYANPLKTYGYMARGKPIVVGDAISFHETLSDGENAIFYNLTPKDLSEKLIMLVNNSDLANKIAIGAWSSSAEYTYEHRAESVLNLIQDVTKYYS